MAISPSSYAVGNRLYKGATSAPTRGRVDPTGYIDRELNKVASRSGIASAALRKMSSGSDPNSMRFGSQGTQAAPQSMTGQSGQIKAIGGGGGMGASQTGLGAALRVSPVGKLQAPKLKETNPTALPFDPESADAQEQLLFSKNKFDQNAVRAEQDLEREYVTRRRATEEEQPNNMRRLLENYAGRGMAYSSGYNYDQGEMNRQYDNGLAELLQSKQGGIADLLRQRGEFNDEFSMNLSQIQKAAARKAAEQAAQHEFENVKAMEEFERQKEAERLRMFPPDAPLSAEQVAANDNYVPPPDTVANFGPVNPWMPTPAGQQQSWSGGTGLNAFGQKNPVNPYVTAQPAPAPAPVAANPKYHQTVPQKAAAPAPVKYSGPSWADPSRGGVLSNNRKRR